MIIQWLGVRWHSMTHFALSPEESLVARTRESPFALPGDSRL